MPETQRKRALQLFRRLKFVNSIVGNDEPQPDIDKMIAHVLDCLGALQCFMGKYDTSTAKVFWAAVSTIAEIGVDATTGHVDQRHPGAAHLLRAFPNDQKANDGRGWLPLHWAAVIDDADVKDVRNIARADPMATTKGFNQRISATPGHLIAAVRHPRMEVVRCLYDFYPRMASSKDNDGDLPLHYAARYSESVEMIQFLLQANSAATRVTGEGNLVPLQCALYNESSEREQIVQCLLDADPSAARLSNHDGDTALHLAVDQECPRPLLDQLITAYPAAVETQNDIGLLPLHIACCCKDSDNVVEVVSLLLERYPEGAKIASTAGLLPVHYAAEHSTAEVLDCLVRSTPKILHEQCTIDNDDTPLFKAIRGSNEATVRYILEHCPEAASYINQLGQHALHIAAESEHLTILQLIHQRCPDALTLRDINQRTALLVFCQTHPEILKETDKETDFLRYLLRYSPEAVEMVDSQGDSPLSVCHPVNTLFRRLLLLARARYQQRPQQLNDRGVQEIIMQVEENTSDTDTNDYDNYISDNNTSNNNTNDNNTIDNGLLHEMRELNYQSRRMGLFLACAAINADGIPNIFSRLRGKDNHLLRAALAFL